MKHDHAIESSSWMGWGFLVGLALLSACASEHSDGRRAKGGGEIGQEQRFRGRPEGDGPDEEELKRSTGISQVGRVVAGGPVLPSTISAGVEEDRLWSDHDDWEPVVACDPSSDFVYQMTTRFDPGQVWVAFRASSDGGESFGPDRVVWRSGRQQYDPQLAVSGDGTVFACWLEVPRWETLVARSFDHGASWTTPVVVEHTLAWTDHPWIAVSENGLDVYVAFNKEDSYVVASHDGGVSFEPPVRTHQTDRIWYHTGGAVTPDGSVYFGGAEYAQTYSGATRINVLRSTDGGASFEKIFLDRSLAPPLCNDTPGCYWGFLGPGTGLAADSEGTLVFAYNAGRLFREAQQIWVRVSHDGLTWQKAVQISILDKAADNAFPVVVAGPEPGDFSVVWQGDHAGDMRAWNTWMSRTFDGGASWSAPLRLSTRPDGAPYKTPKGYAFPYGDYMNAACDRLGRVHAIWGAGASYDGPGGTWYTRTK